MVIVETNSEQETQVLGCTIATHLANLELPLVVSLNGTLGAGKTRLVKGIAEALDVDSELVVSPTFSMVNHYRGKHGLIHHLDLYRVADSDELFELGADELFESKALTLVEWGGRFSECLPDSYLEIEFEILDQQRRRLILKAVGDQEKYQQIASAVADDIN